MVMAQPARRVAVSIYDGVILLAKFPIARSAVQTLESLYSQPTVPCRLPTQRGYRGKSGRSSGL